MKKMIFSLMLAIVSSVWMTSKALCQVDRCTCLFDDPPVAISGILQLVPLPCPESTEDIPCPPCLTIALNANEELYYLNYGLNDNLNALLDTLVYPVNATVTGNVYQAGEEGPAIRVLDISLHASLPSLCDTWNVMEVGLVTSPEEIYHTVTQRLTKDTIIAYPSYYNFTPYARLEENGKYKGAMREEGYGKIYYIPAGSTHEYLLYNFNAKVGDRLTNLWYGGDPEWCPNGYKATVLSISDETPRVFTIEVEYILSDSNGEHIIPWTIYWTEGVGLSDGPAGQFCPGPECACSCGQVLLCAYKNGEQVYVSEMGEQYGCVYNYDPYAPSDTIPLFSYTGDDPGSSTVDPVDPNQVVATLQGNQLTIHEHSGVDVTYTLRHNAPAQMPSLHRAPQSDTFRNEVTVQITESGEYMLQLTNPSWGYTIVGRFNYVAEGIDNVNSSSLQRGDRGRLIIQNGQLYILRGEKKYTVTGQEVR